MSQGPATKNGCLGGGNSCDIYVRPYGPLDSNDLFVVGSLDKHVRNEKEFILALQGSSARVGGFCICVEGINLT